MKKRMLKTWSPYCALRRRRYPRLVVPLPSGHFATHPLATAPTVANPPHLATLVASDLHPLHLLPPAAPQSLAATSPVQVSHPPSHSVSSSQPTPSPPSSSAPNSRRTFTPFVRPRRDSHTPSPNSNQLSTSPIESQVPVATASVTTGTVTTSTTPSFIPTTGRVSATALRVWRARTAELSAAAATARATGPGRPGPRARARLALATGQGPARVAAQLAVAACGLDVTVLHADSRRRCAALAAADGRALRVLEALVARAEDANGDGNWGILVNADEGLVIDGVYIDARPVPAAAAMVRVWKDDVPEDEWHDDSTPEDDVLEENMSEDDNSDDEKDSDYVIDEGETR